MSNKYIPPRGTIRIYFNGGCGVNVGKLLLPRLSEDMKQLPYAEILPAFIDTSRANLDSATSNQDLCFLLQDKDIDGSGQIRRTNAAFMNEALPQILSNFPPADLNIVVSSTSGGSGSTLSPMLTGALLRGGHQVLAISVTGSNTYNEYDNTVNTFKSYAMIAQANKQAIPMAVLRNAPDRKHSEINAQAVSIISTLAVLFSRNNTGLDKADLKNWVNLAACRVTNQPGVYMFNLHVGKIAPSDDEIPVSVATMAMEDMNTDAGVMVEYQTVGLLKPEYASQVQLNEPVHFVISDGVIKRIVDAMTGKLQELKDAEHNRKRGVDTGSIIDSSDQADVGGIIL